MKRWKWMRFALGAAALCLLTVYVLHLTGPQTRMDLETKNWFQAPSFSPLLWGVAMALCLQMMGVVRRDVRPLEWLPAAAVGAGLWALTKTPVWFAPYPAGNVQRLPPLTVFLLGFALTDALRGGLARRGLGFHWQRALLLTGLLLVSAMGDLLFDVMDAVQRNTMKSMIAWKDSLPFAALYYGVPLLRLACGLTLLPLVRRCVPAGAVMAALGLFGCTLLLLSWYESPLGLADWFQSGPQMLVVCEHRALPVYAALLFGGTAAMTKRTVE